MSTRNFVVQMLSLSVLIQAGVAVAGDANADSLLERAGRQVRTVADRRLPQINQIRDDVQTEANNAAARVRNDVAPKVRQTAADARKGLEDAGHDMEIIARDARDNIVDKNRQMICTLIAPEAQQAVSSIIPDGQHVDIPATKLNLDAKLARTKIRISVRVENGRGTPDVDWIDELGQSLANAAVSVDDLLNKYRIKLNCEKTQDITVGPEVSTSTGSKGEMRLLSPAEVAASSSDSIAAGAR